MPVIRVTSGTVEALAVVRLPSAPVGMPSPPMAWLIAFSIVYRAPRIVGPWAGDQIRNRASPCGVDNVVSDATRPGLESP